jgi:glyoxylase-like metal-dependent hydrolase (beta-lactamase superfamily II)
MTASGERATSILPTSNGVTSLRFLNKFALSGHLVKLLENPPARIVPGHGPLPTSNTTRWRILIAKKATQVVLLLIEHFLIFKDKVALQIREGRHGGVSSAGSI